MQRPKYDRNVASNRIFICIFAFRIKILNGNPCAGLIVSTSVGTSPQGLRPACLCIKELQVSFLLMHIEKSLL